MSGFIFKVGSSVFLIILLIITIAIILFRQHYPSNLYYSSSTANITRQKFNIPYIQASSKLAFFYSLGSVHAQDRLFQLSFKRLVFQGRVSQFVGEKALPLDKLMREINLNGWGRKTAKRLKNDNHSQYQLFEAYTNGINDYVSSLTILPIDFHIIGLKWENYTVQSVFSLGKLVQWGLSTAASDEYIRSLLLVNYTKQQIKKFMPTLQQNWAFSSKTTIQKQDMGEQRINDIEEQLKQLQVEMIDGYEELGIFEWFRSSEGSNSWVISGNHTKSGKAILANDPHLENVLPSQWYQIQGVYQHNGRNFRISGVSIPGLPLIVGKTNYLQIGITNVIIDNQDLWKQKVIGDKYMLNGEWKDLIIRKQLIKVKDKELRQEEYIIKQTHRGPLINYIITSAGSFHLNQTISLQWTGFHDHYSSYVAVFNIAQIESLEAATHFFINQSQYLFNFNVIFSTQDQHIGYCQTGIYPIRKHPDSGLFVKDGSLTQHDWVEYLPTSAKVLAIDPQSGFIVSANNRIAFSDYYKGVFKHQIYTARADRIHQMINHAINRNHKFSAEDMRIMQLDTIDSYCVRILPNLLQALPQSTEYFSDFDCNMSAQSSKATIYEVFIYNLYHIIKPYHHDKYSFLSSLLSIQFISNYIKQTSKTLQNNQRSHLQHAWKLTLHNISSFFLSNDSNTWRWGLYHKDVMHHLPFGNTPLSIFYDRSFQGVGNLNTVNFGKMNKIEFGNFQTCHRANYRVIYTSEESWWIIDGGSKENVWSEHYDDQWKLFKQGKLIQIDQFQSPRKISIAKQAFVKDMQL